MSSGYVPLGGVLVGERVRAPFWDEDVPGAVFRHGYTYSGHAGAAAAAMANLDILEGEGLVARVASLEPLLDRELRRLEGAPGVGEVRTVGLTAPSRSSRPCWRPTPACPSASSRAALRHGVATRVLRGHALQVSPPFVITEAEITTLVDGLGAALEDVAGG